MKELGNGDGDFENRLLIVQLMSLYIDNFSARISEITDSIQKKDANALERSAHSLKSSSRLIGLVEFANNCQILEDIGFSKKVEEHDDVYLKIELAAQRIVEVLKNKIAELEKS